MLVHAMVFTFAFMNYSLKVPFFLFPEELITDG